MRLRPDDDIYRARLVYLGPPGYTLPIQLPYVQYFLFVVICGPLSLLGWWLTGDSRSVSVAIGLSLFLTSWVWKHVDPDRPARKVLRTVVRDWRRTKPAEPGQGQDAGQLPTMSTRHVRIGGADR